MFIEPVDSRDGRSHARRGVGESGSDKRASLHHSDEGGCRVSDEEGITSVALSLQRRR